MFHLHSFFTNSFLLYPFSKNVLTIIYLFILYSLLLEKICLALISWPLESLRGMELSLRNKLFFSVSLESRVVCNCLPFVITFTSRKEISSSLFVRVNLSRRYIVMRYYTKAESSTSVPDHNRKTFST